MNYAHMAGYSVGYLHTEENHQTVKYNHQGIWINYYDLLFLLTRWFYCNPLMLCLTHIATTRGTPNECEGTPDWRSSVPIFSKLSCRLCGS